MDVKTYEIALVREIEKKWQEFWQANACFEPIHTQSSTNANNAQSKVDFTLPKKYILSMLPYPSGRIHMGHVRNYCIGDALARHYRKMGYNVLHPMGWDSFGMPAENAAIKHKIHPKIWTYENIDTMRAELESLGLSFSRQREFATSDAIYTRFEQEFFIQMWEKGLIYRKEAFLNWCPNDKTVLANEQVIDGKCWRCDTPVVQKEMSQYYMKITAYAEELLRDLDGLEGHWANQVITMQRNWIGKSRGLEFSFSLDSKSCEKLGLPSQKSPLPCKEGLEVDAKSKTPPLNPLPQGEKKTQSNALDSTISVFTTRPDTIYGVTYCALAPEHAIVKRVLELGLLDSSVASAIKAMQNTSERDRAVAEKMGFDLGLELLHPLTGQKLPLWVANYVLIEYGSGAVMAVPAHDERDFEFALKYGLSIKRVVKSKEDSEFKADLSEEVADSTHHLTHSAKNSLREGESNEQDDNENLAQAFVNDGILLDSGEFSGLSSEEARAKIIKHFESKNLGKGVTNYKLRDWGVSRQRYWGAPIPMVHCEQCGIVPERLENLPITLPDDILIDGEGNPLDKHDLWKHCTCPKCGAKALRESDTMDTFVESSWYFLRYTTPRELWEKAAFDSDSLRYWLNIDEYIGGIEHAILHLLYARFFTKVLRDLGYVEIDEPFANLLTQGMVLKDGAKMSKSKGNVVDPNALIQKYGADSARLFVLFAAPPVRELEWNDSAVEGSYRFIRRLYERAKYAKKCNALPKIDAPALNEAQKNARKKVYEALQKSNALFEKRANGYAFNTVIAACMEALNALSVAESNAQSSDTNKTSKNTQSEQNAQNSDIWRDIWTEGYFILLNILEPIIPHIAWELSEELFNRKNFAPIAIDKTALEVSQITLAITINGKKRAEIEVPSDIGEDELLTLAKQSVAKWLNGEIIKQIVVPKKLVNFVLKP
ncbi:leucine--tRNA ligase [Helicobacter sp. 23-1048]